VSGVASGAGADINPTIGMYSLFSPFTFNRWLIFFS
jgi:hypothetical protein